MVLRGLASSCCCSAAFLSHEKALTKHSSDSPAIKATETLKNVFPCCNIPFLFSKTDLVSKKGRSNVVIIVS